MVQESADFKGLVSKLGYILILSLFTAGLTPEKKRRVALGG